MKVQYASVGAPSTPSVTSVSGGTVTSSLAGTKQVYLQLQSRGGYSLVSAAASISVGVGQKIRISIPQSAVYRLGWDLHNIIILLSPTSNVIDASVVAVVPYLINNDPITFPYIVELTDDEHLMVGEMVQNLLQLPTNPTNGMRRYVSALGQMLEYDELADDWVECSVNSFSTYVSDTSDPTQFGCDRSLADITSNAGLVIPEYDPNVGGMSQPVKYWLVNDTKSEIPQGTRVRFSINVGDIDYSTEFAGKAFITPLGYVDILTGGLDTGISGVNMEYTYQGDVQSDLVLSKPLPKNEAYAFSAKINYRDYEIRSEILKGNTIKLLPRFANAFARYDEGAEIMGDFILPKSKFRRVVPRNGGAAALDGAGRVKGYTFRDLGEQPVVGIQLGTANQKVAISNDGTVFAAAIIPDTAVQRCVLGTVGGVGKIFNAGSVTLNATKELTIEITHPTIIRVNYPDVIAGSAEGELNASKAVLFVKLPNNTYVTFNSELIVEEETSKVITLNSITGTAIANLPVNPDNTFGLYEPANITLTTSNGASSFTTGVYEFWIGYLFENNQITTISHDPVNGSIYEVSSSIADVMQVYRSWGDSIQNPYTPRDIPQNKTFPYQARKFNGDEIIYLPDSIAADNAVFVWKPTWNTGAGRWHLNNQVRFQVQTITPVLLPGGVANIGIPIGFQANIYKVSADKPCRVRLYQSANYRTQDAARLLGALPPFGKGLILEVETTTQLEIDLSPIATAINLDISENIAAAITNLSNVANAITVEFKCFK
jgi:hypothetical protein